MKRVMENAEWTLFSPVRRAGPARQGRPRVRGGLPALRGQGRARRAEAVQEDSRRCSCGARCCRCCSRPGIPGSRSRIPATCAARSSTSASCTARTCAPRSRSTPRTDEIAVCNLGSVNLVAHLIATARHEPGSRQAAAAPSAPRCACSTTSSTSTTTRSTRRAIPTCATARWAWASWASRTACTCCASPTPRRRRWSSPTARWRWCAYCAYWASTELAEERGRYPTFHGSLWDRGILPQDTLDLLAAERGGYVEVDRSLGARLGAAARAHQAARHAQLQLHRDRADRDHRQHHRRLGLARADLPEPVREVEPVGRVHRRQRVPGVGPEARRACGTRS